MSTALRPYVRVFLLACTALVCGRTVSALDPSLDISQYAHTAWSFRDGFLIGTSTQSRKPLTDISGWARSRVLFALTALERARASLLPGQQLPTDPFTGYSRRATVLFGSAPLLVL